jgi:hypothetical protein
MKKVLVIHPNDSSTDFLKPIYANIPNATVVRGGVTRADVDQEIIKHDRIIMLGHGSPGGLFSIGEFFGNGGGFIISHGTADLLRDKECIFIWCNADKFVNEHNLKGLYSGMFISEVGEAEYCGTPSSQEVVTESNDYFANELGKVSNLDLNEIHSYIKTNYGVLAESNDVANYNNNRIYLA